MAAVPKAANKTIRYAKVKACYYNNTNAAYFDNISMTEEPVQTYKYDDSSPKLDVSYSYRTRNSTNQLTEEIQSARTSDYAYDTYGNIRSKTNSYSDGTTDSYSYSYENADWLDLLTKVSYTDKTERLPHRA